MAEKTLHPSVSKFKEFVAQNPHLIEEVRNRRATWQQLYEEWYLLGDGDPRWKKPDSVQKEGGEEKDAGKTEWITYIYEMAKKMDPAQLQSHLSNLSMALGTVQGLLSQFGGKTPPEKPERKAEPLNQPFPFRKD